MFGYTLERFDGRKLATADREHTRFVVDPKSYHLSLDHQLFIVTEEPISAEQFDTLKGCGLYRLLDKDKFEKNADGSVVVDAVEPVPLAIMNGEYITYLPVLRQRA